MLKTVLLAEKFRDLQRIVENLKSRLAIWTEEFKKNKVYADNKTSINYPPLIVENALTTFMKMKQFLSSKELGVDLKLRMYCSIHTEKKPQP